MNVGLYMSRTRAFPPFIAHRPRRFARAEVQPGAEVASSGLSTNHPSAAKPTIKPPRQIAREETPTRRPLGDLPGHAWGIPGHARGTKTAQYFATPVGPQVHDLSPCVHCSEASGFASLCNYGKLSRMANAYATRRGRRWELPNNRITSACAARGWAKQEPRPHA